MPEIGESVHEGTVSRWLKKEGEFVKEDEPVVEIMTDKVNTELPSPATGILAKILIPEGSQVEVFAPMGIIEEKGSVGASAAKTEAPAAKKEEAPKQEAAPAPKPAAEPMQPAASAMDGGRRWYTPVVRSIAKQNGVSEAELAAIPGSGGSGRVTKKDLEDYLSSGRTATPQAPSAAPKIEAKPAAPIAAGPDQQIVPLAGMRKMIADAMVRAAAVPVVSTVTQADVTPMVQFREANKDLFQQQHGVKLTYTPFFIKALTETLLEFPMVNASLQGDQVVMNRSVHMGIAVALGSKGDEGLIVPVIRNCEQKSLIDLAKDLDSIAKKARSNQLSVADVQGGTFTLTNPGTYGALFGTPMINAPQAGILGAYAITKQPVIINDMIGIRSIMHLALTYDHRIVDGLLAGRFLGAVRDRLEKFDFFK